MRSFFITPFDYIDANARGGVQWCTADYLKTIQLAGLEPEVRAFQTDQRFTTKIKRRIFPHPFAYQVPPSFVQRVIDECRAKSNALVFLNNTVTNVLAQPIRDALGSRVKIVLLSHGVENTDIVNALRQDPLSLPSHVRNPRWLGQVIHDEIRQRQAVDLVICISEEDVLFENWLGSPSCLFLPRTVEPKDLDWKPLSRRIGTVATLNHGPNVDGIRQLAKQLDRLEGMSFRVVGSPKEVGDSLQREHSSVQYLGRLSDQELRDEAGTWCAFTNPIFCQARGSSTKVATALGWGLPVATTVAGARGYRWNDSLITRPNKPNELAKLCEQMSADNHAVWRDRACQLRMLAPSFQDCAGYVLAALEDLEVESTR